MKDSCKLLEITTFGTFSVTADGRPVMQGSPRSGKIWTLLKYLLAHRASPIPTEKLIEVLWPGGEVEKPVKALFTLVYRLRGILNSPFDEKQDFILFSHDCYTWNADAPYTLDSERFDSLCATIESSGAAIESGGKNSDALFTIGREAFDLYRGGYLQELSEDWAIPINYYYRRLFAKLTSRLSQLYSEKGDFSSVVSLCERAIALDPYEETHYISLIDALIRLQKPSHALSHYDFITHILRKDLGVEPSAALLELRKGISQHFDEYLDAAEIKELLSEQSEIFPGAFFCDIDTFRHLFRLGTRMSKRGVYSMFLTEVSLSFADSGDNAASADEAMNILRRTVLMTLRRNDVVTQHSRTQLLLLLQSDTAAGCEQAVKRIAAMFRSDAKNKVNCDMNYSFAPLR